MAVILVLLAITGCAFRPDASVLQPRQPRSEPTQTVRVLSVTNRAPLASGYGSVRANALFYELYTISVPVHRKAAEIRYVSSRADPDQGYMVIGRQPLTQRAFLDEAMRGVTKDKTAAMFVHGYNQSFQEALFRLAQVNADSGLRSSPIMFSWPSEANLSGYVADRNASLASRDDLVALIELLGSQSDIHRIAIAGHSMGAFLVMESLRQLKMAARADVLAKLGVVLAAPDIDIDLFQSQVETIGRLSTPIVVMVSRNDRALAISSLIGSDRPRLGALDINDRRVQALIERFGIAVVDISSIRPDDALGHDGFASMAQYAGRFAALDSQRNGIGAAGAFMFDATHALLVAPLR